MTKITQIPPVISPVILSGGSGTRLWPLSRAAYPKQFIDLVGEHSLMQQTCLRFDAPLFAPVSILCNEAHRFLVGEQLSELGLEPGNIILEPVGRNTAPAALVAALINAEHDPERLILLLPSDHVIDDTHGFQATIEQGVDAAQSGNIITFGVRPDAPETGCGYIETIARNGESVLDVERFVEKPSHEKAEEYLCSDVFFWNAGIFLYSVQTMIEAFEAHAPDILKHCRAALKHAESDLDFLRLDRDAYEQCKNISLDYGIIEKIDNIKCVPLETPWSDLGAWSAIWAHMNKDANGNVMRGDAILHDVTGSYIHSADGACLTVVGLDNVMAIATKDAILITSKDRAQDVKHIVDELKARGRDEVVEHMRVYRPWGWYEGLGAGDRFQVKSLMVKPGSQLSLQSHFHRAEHWVVVEGTAEVTVGDNTVLLTENQSTYIPIGATHRLGNPGKLPTLLIEVQSGAYLGEDDIVRHDDDFGRDNKVPIELAK